MNFNNDYHRLLAGVDSWNQWRLENPTVTPDLRNVRLNAESCADLWNADSQLIDLRRINLQGCNLELAGLDRVDLTEADLSFCNLQGCEISHSVLRACNLVHTTLSHGIFDRVDFNRCQMRESVFAKCHWVNSSADSADLISSSFFESRIEKSSFKNSQLSYSSFSAAQVDDCTFYLSDMSRVDFNHAKLRRVSLDEVCLQRAELHYCTFVDSSFKRSQLKRSDFQHASLVNANCKGVSLLGANLEACDLSGANLQYADLRHTNLSGVKFNGKGLYRGIRLEGGYSSPQFIRFAKDQEFIEEVKGEKGSARYWFIYLPWLISSNCGRSIFLWAIWSMLVAIAFAGRYWSLGPEHFDLAHLEFNFSSMLYYSLITFTTLGYGDITPKTNLATGWVMVEVVFGYIMLGGLISIFANKLARRS